MQFVRKYNSKALKNWASCLVYSSLFALFILSYSSGICQAIITGSTASGGAEDFIVLENNIPGVEVRDLIGGNHSVNCYFLNLNGAENAVNIDLSALGVELGFSPNQNDIVVDLVIFEAYISDSKDNPYNQIGVVGSFGNYEIEIELDYYPGFGAITGSTALSNEALPEESWRISILNKTTGERSILSEENPTTNNEGNISSIENYLGTYYDKEGKKIINIHSGGNGKLAYCYLFEDVDGGCDELFEREPQGPYEFEYYYLWYRGQGLTDKILLQFDRTETNYFLTISEPSGLTRELSKSVSQSHQKELFVANNLEEMKPKPKFEEFLGFYHNPINGQKVKISKLKEGRYGLSGNSTPNVNARLYEEEKSEGFDYRFYHLGFPGANQSFKVNLGFKKSEDGYRLTLNNPSFPSPSQTFTKYQVKPAAPAKTEKKNENALSRQFKITRRTYSEKDNLDAAVQHEFGSDYRVADWNDIKQLNEKKIKELAWLLGMSEKGKGSLMITKNGKHFYGRKRHYFMSFHNGRKPRSYLAHDQINGYFISLGSWYGIRQHILCVRR